MSPITTDHRDHEHLLCWDGDRRIGGLVVGARLSDDAKRQYRLEMTPRCGETSDRESRMYEAAPDGDLWLWLWEDVITQISVRGGLVLRGANVFSWDEQASVVALGPYSVRDDIAPGLTHLTWLRPSASTEVDVQIALIDGGVGRVSIDNDDPLPD